MFTLMITLALLTTGQVPQQGAWETYIESRVYEGKYNAMRGWKCTWLDQQEVAGEKCRLLEILPLNHRTLEPESVDISGRLWLVKESYLRSEIPWDRGLAGGWWYLKQGQLTPSSPEALRQGLAREFFVPGFQQDAKEFEAPAREIVLKKKKAKLTKTQRVVHEYQTAGGGTWRFTAIVWPHTAGPGGIGSARVEHETVNREGQSKPFPILQYDLIDYGIGGKQTIKLP